MLPLREAKKTECNTACKVVHPAPGPHLVPTREVTIGMTPVHTSRIPRSLWGERSHSPDGVAKFELKGSTYCCLVSVRGLEIRTGPQQGKQLGWIGEIQKEVSSLPSS